MRAAIILAMALLAGCKSEGDRFADDYAQAESDPSLTGRDMCNAATAASDAYQREHDLAKASEWRSKAALSCSLSAGRPN